ncbi:glycosyltransferase [Actinomadura flavalba]|uniref:glycosyltransferase n=1 Tax=Actinomadura flavalba TaxID=1120938 RepID=UPI00039E6CBF|nr:glycosyltransferase [Actinomadura flavalba]
MRVLHVITGLGQGGAERQLVGLLRRAAVECEVVALTNAGSVAGEIRALGVPVHDLGMRGNRDLAALPRLVRIMRDGRFDVVHTHLYRACVFGRIAARMAGIRRIVATEHSLGDGEIEGRRAHVAVRALYRATERLGTVTVAVSPTVAERLRGWGVPGDRITVIPNGLDPAEFAYAADRRAAVRADLGIDAGEAVVGAIGRLVPSKRFDLLIDAFADLPGGTLLLAGDGPERAALERRAAPLGRRVRFLGETGDAAGVLAALDVYAVPSVQETFGLSVLEAMASGLPVLYTRCPAVDDVPAELAPYAERLPTDVAAWRAALARFDRPPAARLPVPPVVAHYDLDPLARALADLYGAGRPTVRTPPRQETHR